jgi:uncharacterized protein (TIGR00369 family)
MDGVEDPRFRAIAEGPWAGWQIWGTDPYEDLSGPFYTRYDEDGRAVCAFVAAEKHMNGGGFMHGGCLMTFADYALFSIARDAISGGQSVTAAFNAEFIDAARVGERIEARGEVVRGGKSLVFVRGLITTGDRTLLSFSAILKKVGRHA